MKIIMKKNFWRLIKNKYRAVSYIGIKYKY